MINSITFHKFDRYGRKNKRIAISNYIFWLFEQIRENLNFEKIMA